MTSPSAGTLVHEVSSRPEPVRGVKGGATRILASTVGAILGVSGIEHGVGEALQGNVAPPAMVFPSWPGSDFFRIFNGEPAFSLVPNLLATGILAILVGTIVTIWAALFIGRKNGGWVLIGLLVLQFLVGGGIAGLPPGILTGLAATRIGAPLRWWKARLSPRVRQVLAKTWMGSFVIGVAGWLLVFPGLSILALYLGANHPATVPLIMVTLGLAIGFLVMGVVAGFARDLRSREGAVAG
jgi:hypothetical protein